MGAEKDRKETLIGDIYALAWTYAQKTGELQQDRRHVATGYSGADAGKNNPEMENVRDVGPIPHGDWKIVGPPVDTPEHGPYVLTLQPAADTQTFGRNGFLMHGDSKESPGCASHGCVIMPRLHANKCGTAAIQSWKWWRRFRTGI